MKVKVEELSPYERRLEVEVPADEVDRSFGAVVQRLRTQARIPGFRPGKVPRDIFERRFGPAIRREVVEDLLERTLDRALVQSGTNPVTDPVVRADGVAEGEPFRYTLQFEVIPEVTVKGLDELTLPSVPVEVTEADVDEEIEHLRSHHAELHPVEGRDRPRKGDQVTFESRTVGGEVPPGGGRTVTAVLGDDSLLPEVEEALLAGRVGEPCEVTLRLPESHPDREVAGREVRLLLTIREIKERVLPDLDDEFARDQGEENLEALRRSVRDRLLKARSEQAREEEDDGLLRALLAKNEFPVPPLMVRQRAEVALRTTMAMVQRAGVGPGRLGLDPEKLARETFDRTVETVREGILVDAVARQEGITVSDDEVREEVGQLAREKGRPEAFLRASLSAPQQMAALRREILRRKVLAFLRSRATIH